MLTESAPRSPNRLHVRVSHRRTLYYYPCVSGARGWSANDRTNRKPPYRLGLDIGANSIGWAALTLDKRGDPCATLAMGSRIFPDGRTQKSGTSLARDRRLARGQRRRRKRYLRRRDALMRKLVAFGLMPASAKKRKELERRDPYELRKRALSERLEPSELGRALFHLHQRRGFKSNRKAGGGEDKKKATQARKDREGLSQAISASGNNPTLGEFLAARRERREPVRARPGQELYPERAMYEREFKEIRARQAEDHARATAQWDELRRIIFHQRPLKPVEPGWCLLEDGEQRAPKADLAAQEFRILQEVNNLRLVLPGGGGQPLNPDERARVLRRLREGKDIELQDPVKLLKLPDGASLNLARGGRKAIKGDQTTKRLADKKLFGDGWFKRSDQAAVVEFLIDAEDPEQVRLKAEQEWGLDADRAQRLAMAELPPGYVHLSLKAIRNLLPHLREGKGYDKAVKAAGYPHHSDFRNAEAHDRLPYYGVVLERDVMGANRNAPESDEAKRYGRFPNPTVHVGLNQLRRVVNRLIEVYGKPQDIVVELARELGMGAKRRNALRKTQNENEERNARYRKMLASKKTKASSETFRKLRLWEEQGEICVYTGRKLTFNMVISNKTEIDHILPRSWSLDNAMSNKVVCVAAANALKGDQTPYEAFAGDPDGYDYAAILARANELPDSKKWRFLKDAREVFESKGDFLDRHFNDTAYLSLTARRYLAYLYDEKNEGKVRVRAIPGRMTAELREAWGLRKRRDDHRHHAVDAFVAACTTQGLLELFAEASRNGGDAVKLLAESEDMKPWAEFNPKELGERRKRVIVSHKQEHAPRPKKGGSTGRLHDATAYGLPAGFARRRPLPVTPLLADARGAELPEPGDGPSRVTIRRPLAEFDEKDLQAVQGNALKTALTDLWEKTGGDSAEFARRASEEGVWLNGRMRIVRKARLVETQRVIAVVDKKSGAASKGYILGGNEFADLWRMPDGAWKISVVTTFEFNQRGDENALRPHPAAKRLARIYKGDMAALGEGPDRKVVRVRKIDNAKTGVSIYMDDHNEANVDKRIRKKELEAKKYSVRQLRASAFRKVGVDEIGRLRDPVPFREAGGAAKEPNPAEREKSARPRPAEAKPRQLGLSLGG